jgi:hypothetical protein
LDPIRQRTALSGKVSLEILAARARVDPLKSERGFNPRESRTAARRAALFFADAAKSKWIPLHANWNNNGAALWQVRGAVVPMIHRYCESAIANAAF